MADAQSTIKRLARTASSRTDLWTSFIVAQGCETVAEIGVYRGQFAERLLSDCPAVSRFYMIDPWRHLDEWNKPANRSDAVFERFFAETLDRTSGFADKRVILRGKTTEVVDEIPDESLDLAYVDGDHTLRGISVDLINIFPKVKVGGFIAGDDFCRSIWQHQEKFEPTLVFPFAVYFAEAVGARIYALPYRQMLIEKSSSADFAFIDLTDSYDELGLRAQLLEGSSRRAARPAARRSSDDHSTPTSVIARLRTALSSRRR